MQKSELRKNCLESQIKAKPNLCCVHKGVFFLQEELQ